MKVILLKGKQGTEKSSLFGPALFAHFGLTGPVAYFTCGQDSDQDISRKVALMRDPKAAIIVETNDDSAPDVGAQFDYVVTIEHGRDFTSPKFDPSGGDGRFKQCAACSGYYGRRFYARDVNPCPCGRCEPAELYQPLLPEKSQPRDPVLHRIRTALSRALARMTARRSPPAMRSERFRAADLDALEIHRNSYRLERRSDTDRPHASPFVESPQDSAPPTDVRNAT